jgi:hypothetical protein
VDIDLAEIFRQYGEQYLAHYGPHVPVKHRQVIRAVERCRTEALGGHIYRCPDCQEQVYRYHSCRNRHCPKCQQLNSQQWLARQQDLRLPVPYFLLTFTLPDGLRALALKHQSLIYQLLFRASAAATQQLAQDPRFVGGKIGMVGVMHTWGRNLSYHPHIHYLVPAGGLRDDGEWVAARQNFLVPVKALSRLLRAKFRAALRKQNYFEEVPASVWQQEWVVHCQPVGDGEAALKYLAPYIFRVAITNNRILKMENGRVTFCYRDTQTRKMKHCTLTALEFMRRFLQHVLPKGFVKVRYYGFFSAGNRKLLARIRQKFAQPLILPDMSTLADTDACSIDQTYQDTLLCPHCGTAMQLFKTIHPNGRAPPKRTLFAK